MCPRVQRIKYSTVFLILPVFFIFSCSSNSKKNQATAVKATPPAATETAAPTNSAIAQPAEMELKLKNEQAAAVAHSEQAHSAPQARADNHSQNHSQNHRHAGDISAEKALGWLKNGNRRFTKGFLRKDGQAASDLERLSKGQKPHSIVLSCSDSRVPPEVVFDQKLGEIFVVRTAGQTLDYGAIASIEYALAHLGSNLIVVMGHESCGAVKAALTATPGQDIGSPYLNQLVAQIKPRLMKTPRAEASHGLIKEGWENVQGVTEDLVAKSEIIRDALQSGGVKIQPALYHLGSGQVEWAPGTAH